jgi:large subunit ribosomal protein L18
MSVFKSNKHLYVQVIDDTVGKTLVSVSSRGGQTKGLKPTVADGEKMGEAIGAQMKEQKIAQAVFDRNGHLYHGVVKAVADGARKAGIQL